MKYDSQAPDLKDTLNQANNVLIALPSQTTIDKLAAGLALFLSLKQAQKQANIITEDTIKVSHSHLFGVGDIKNQYQAIQGGNLILSLGGVAASDGNIPSLEKLDWFTEDNNLNLVFHVLPGKSFEPTDLKTNRQTVPYDQIIVLGAASLNDLGKLYTDNQKAFQDAKIINIDNNTGNSQFGQVNIVDTSAGTLSEIVAQLLSGLGLPFEGDIATNLVTGIYDATNNLTQGVKPDTFSAVALTMQAGGKLPTTQPQSEPSQPKPTKAEPQTAQTPVQPSIIFQPAAEVVEKVTTSEPTQPQNQEWFSFASPVAPGQPVVPGMPMSNDNPVQNNAQAPQPDSPEEKPTGEQAVSGSPEAEKPAPDWLTPKVFRGGSLE